MIPELTCRVAVAVPWWQSGRVGPTAAVKTGVKDVADSCNSVGDVCIMPKGARSVMGRCVDVHGLGILI
jgi:hypothetical protein